MADGVFIEQQDFRHELDFANLGVRFVRKPRRCGVIRRGELPVISPRFSTTSFSATGSPCICRCASVFSRF